MILLKIGAVTEQGVWSSCIVCVCINSLDLCADPYRCMCLEVPCTGVCTRELREGVCTCDT